MFLPLILSDAAFDWADAIKTLGFPIVMVVVGGWAYTKGHVVPGYVYEQERELRMQREASERALLQQVMNEVTPLITQANITNARVIEALAEERGRRVTARRKIASD